MKHRTRTSSTHLMTVTRYSDSDETDEYGQPIPGGEEEIVINEERVVFKPEGTDLTRTSTGEVVDQSPQIKGRDLLAYEVLEGDDVILDPLDPRGSEVSGLEVVTVRPVFSRHKRPSHCILELEAI